MGENEQGGMLRSVVVVGVVALISTILISAMFILKHHNHVITVDTQNNSMRAVALANEVVDDYSKTNYSYTFDTTSGTATLTGAVSAGAVPKDIVLPSYVVKDGTKYTVTRLGTKAFYSIPLDSVAVPNTVTTIDWSVFEYSHVETVILGDNITDIGGYAFASCRISTLILPSKLQNIQEFAFKANSIADVRIPDSVKSIGPAAFYMNELRMVYVPKTANVDAKAFDSGVDVEKS